MGDIEFYMEKDAESAAKNAAGAIVEIFSKYKDLPVLFLVSGGSPMEILKHLTADAFDSRVTMSVSDERLSVDPTVNNFAQTMHTDWYKAIVKKEIRTIDTRPSDGESLVELADRFNRALKHWKQSNPTGKIVMTQGVGLDGHTVGIMPARHRYAQALAGGPYPDDIKLFYELFENPDVWVVGYDAKEKNKYPLRVTITMPFLRIVDDSVVYVCGPEKQKPLTETLTVSARRGLAELSATPARIIHEMKHCLLFTDLAI